VLSVQTTFKVEGCFIGGFRVSVDTSRGYVHTIAQLKVSKSQVTEASCCNGEQPLCLKHKHRSLKLALND